MRRCGRCGHLKTLEDFAWRRRVAGQRDNYCRPCRAAYKREHYDANRERYIAQAPARRRKTLLERIGWIIEFLGQHPCVDCAESDPLVLEFDHRGEKSFSISTALPSRPWSAILNEIAKCDVVCANCHRRRTARRGGFLRAMLLADEGPPLAGPKTQT